ncbi:MAG TPA: glycine cleavage system aminomethyltransferase GcvT [Pirellulales bacterium]|nr:glycine cleavage system aminomethyltransferase GcvT [Pirellulales bacterium]
MLLRTPLHDWHAAHGGRMVDFAGWSMPVQYTGIVAEHTAARTACGVFDISHMGRLGFQGAGGAEFLDHLVTRRVTDLAPGGIRYALVTNDSGGILDDVLVYHVASTDGGSYYLMVVNASNREKILKWLEPQLRDAADVNFADITSTWAMIAVQGPQALALAQPLVSIPLAAMKYYTGAECYVSGQRAVVSRTGYTGEDGCEIMVESAAATGIWQTLIDAGATACGLGARDTLRLEAAMPLYGHELNESITPYQAGLGFAVNLGGRSFPGHAALARAKDDPALSRRVGLELAGRRVPREHYPVLIEGRPVGEVTSGTFSPTLGKPIAMAYVEPAAAQTGTALGIDVRGHTEPATVVPLPFYKRK